MARSGHRLTRAFIAELCKRIQGGAFEAVASEALGVPAEVLGQWLARGELPQAPPVYRELAAGIRRARAAARLAVEIKMREEQPKLWLLNGPGRETPARPGWSAPARPGGAGDGEGQAGWPPQVLQLLGEFRRALLPFPDALASVDAVLRRALPERPPGE